ncbi:MAG: hypothetical protein BWX47_01414 [candidate division Hyd24-12 bacterium ADurb.Bin004]|nr:MAG: hypothetical protein BWX47_01414 [candidate division Hyd24-12 bacterium ADurb.Bin004]
MNSTGLKVADPSSSIGRNTACALTRTTLSLSARRLDLPPLQEEGS